MSKMPPLFGGAMFDACDRAPPDRAARAAARRRSGSCSSVSRPYLNRCFQMLRGASRGHCSVDVPRWHTADQGARSWKFAANGTFETRSAARRTCCAFEHPPRRRARTRRSPQLMPPQARRRHRCSHLRRRGPVAASVVASRAACAPVARVARLSGHDIDAALRQMMAFDFRITENRITTQRTSNRRPAQCHASDQQINGVLQPDSGSASSGYSNDSAQANSAPHLVRRRARPLARRHQHRRPRSSSARERNPSDRGKSTDG